MFVKHLYVKIEDEPKEEKFVEELEALCKKYAKDENYAFDWEGGDP